jgi:hypothetical protein
MVRRVVLVAVVAWVLALSVVGSTVAGSGCTQGEGRIWLPWGPSPPPVAELEGEVVDLHLIFYYVVSDLRPGQSFRLSPVGADGEIICIQGECVHEPDFNIAFMVDSGLVHGRLEVFDDSGPVEGVVPSNADYAVVWMNTGANPLGLDEAPLDAVFSLKQGC